MSFKSLCVSPSLLSTLEKIGFRTPTPVQTAALPKALQGRDLMVSAQTGSGKTAAFMLPAIQRVLQARQQAAAASSPAAAEAAPAGAPRAGRDRKSTRLNSSHVAISYAVFC